MDEMIHYADTTYGFEWGAAAFQRCSSDDKKGWVTLSITTPKEYLYVYVTKTGKVRIFSRNWKEWKPLAGGEVEE